MGVNFDPVIMIVESFGSNTKSLHGHLVSLAASAEIVSANDSESALARIQSKNVDLFIIDSCLKGQMDGYDFCRAVRSGSSHRDVPIILLLSGFLSLERSKGILAGADLLLHRPIVKEELAKMLELLLGSRLRAASPRGASYDNFPASRLPSIA